MTTVPNRESTLGFLAVMLPEATCAFAAMAPAIGCNVNFTEKAPVASIQSDCDLILSEDVMMLLDEL